MSLFEDSGVDPLFIYSILHIYLFRITYCTQIVVVMIIMSFAMLTLT